MIVSLLSTALLVIQLTFSSCYSRIYLARCAGMVQQQLIATWMIRLVINHAHRGLLTLGAHAQRGL